MKGILTLVINILLVLTGILAYAKPADPRPKKFVQPNGETITVKIRGDERSHFFLSEDDYLLVREGEAFYYGNVDEKGTLKTSSILANPVSKRTAAEDTYLGSVNMDRVYRALSEKAESAPRKMAPARSVGLFPGNSFPAKGSTKAIVVLVDYQDVSFTLDDPYDYFYRMLNEDGFSDYGATGSVVEYFRDNSCGQFEPVFDLYGPVTLAHDRSYYGGNDMWGNDQNPEKMAIEACQQLDDEVDFRQYDTNGDGYIDNLYIFYAGMGEASGGAASTVWPHSWDISAATSTVYKFDGVQLDRYACSNEWESGEPDGIGTFTHEFSHVMGLPDLYATNYAGAFTPGSWSALDYGPYNNDGRTPPAYGAFERYALDWMKPKVIDGPNNITLPEISTNQAYIINTEDPNEFFLLENRQQNGWDTYIPGHGMLIWHIDYDESVWSSNRVNNDSSHQHVDIEEADNTQNSSSRDGDAFPGTKNITVFNDYTKPSMKTWAGQGLNLPLTEISENDGIITFYVAGGVADLCGVELSDATNITASTCDISWTKDENAVKYLVSVYTKSYAGDREIHNYVYGWDHADVGDTDHVTVNGMLPETLYYCVVNSSNGPFLSEDSNEIEFITGEPTFEFLSPVAIDASDVEKTSFVAHWEAMDGVNSYIIDVYNKGELESNVDICDFTGGVSKMPAGWVTNSKLTYANTAYSGNAIPALRLASADAFVASPTYQADVKYVKFWYRGSNASAQNSIRVMALISANYVQIAELSILNDVGGQNVCIDEVPTGTRAIRIVYHEEEHAGSLAIDDIEIGWDSFYPVYPIEEYTDKEVGDVLEATIIDLLPSTTYYYTVKGTDGQKVSKISNEISVTTLEGSGISDVSMAATISNLGNGVYVSANPGERVGVYDILGRQVTTHTIGNSGNIYFTVPSKGLYIIRCGGAVYKLKN